MKIWGLFFVMNLILLPITNAAGDGNHGMSDAEGEAVLNCVKTIECCAEHVPISWMGYKSGHKHNFCRNLGFDTYRPSTSECITNCNNKKTKTTPLQFLGYKKGHKHNLCIQKGYDGYRPAPKGDKKPWGYCYKNK